jgi:hypothetical protein
MRHYEHHYSSWKDIGPPNRMGKVVWQGRLQLAMTAVVMSRLRVEMDVEW